MDRTSKPIAKTLERYARINGQFVTSLRHELHFYLGAVNLVRRFQAAGMSLCRPDILLINERAGVLNLGAEGMMLVAAIAGFATAFTDMLGGASSSSPITSSSSGRLHDFPSSSIS